MRIPLAQEMTCVYGLAVLDGQHGAVRHGVFLDDTVLGADNVDLVEVRTGFECGAGIANFNDIKVGDILECYSVSKMSAVQAGAAQK